MPRLADLASTYAGLQLLVLVTACTPADRTGSSERGTEGPRALPVRVAADRFFVRPVTVDNDTLTLYTDTGGGLFLYADAAARLGLEADSTGTVALPPLHPDALIPAPAGSRDGRLPVLDERPDGFDVGDGMLGQAWFADRVWTFDYPAGRLLLWPDASGRRDAPPAHSVALGFQTDSTGRRTLSFPRIRIEVDGDSLDVLFDTGATVWLTDSAVAELADGGLQQRATSFITAGVMQRWRARHPEWRVLENADRFVPGMAMIEVPEMAVGGWRVGPVWFTERPDRNFHEFMSGFMDQRVEGALGGSGLRFFRVTVDYPAAIAEFERM